MKVLIVDDEKIWRDILEEEMRAGLAGAETKMAESHEEAARLTAEHVFDLAVLDMRFPDQAGVQSSEAGELLYLDLVASNPAMKFIFVSTVTKWFGVLRARRQGHPGIVGFLNKNNYNMPDLVAILESAFPPTNP